MRDIIGKSVLAGLLVLIVVALAMVLVGCGPQDDSAPNGGATTCAGTGHVKICAPDGAR